MNNFKERLIQILKELDLSQNQFATKIGTYQSTISKWMNEEAHNRPTVEQLEEMVKIYGINVSWLLTGIGSPFILKKNIAEMSIVSESHIENTYNSELQRVLKELADCRKETLEIYRQLNKSNIHK